MTVGLHERSFWQPNASIQTQRIFNLSVGQLRNPQELLLREVRPHELEGDSYAALTDEEKTFAQLIMPALHAEGPKRGMPYEVKLHHKRSYTGVFKLHHPKFDKDRGAFWHGKYGRRELTDRIETPLELAIDDLHNKVEFLKYFFSPAELKLITQLTNLFEFDFTTLLQKLRSKVGGQYSIARDQVVWEWKGTAFSLNSSWVQDLLGSLLLYDFENDQNQDFVETNRLATFLGLSSFVGVTITSCGFSGTSRGELVFPGDVAKARYLKILQDRLIQKISKRKDKERVSIDLHELTDLSKEDWALVFQSGSGSRARDDHFNYFEYKGFDPESIQSVYRRGLREDDEEKFLELFEVLIREASWIAKGISSGEIDVLQKPSSVNTPKKFNSTKKKMVDKKRR